MKKFSKVLALGLAATMLGGVFVGCGKDDTTAPTTPTTDNADTTTPADTETPAAPVTLKTVSMFGGTDPTAPAYEAGIESFKAANPNVTIQDESAVANDAWKSSILTDFAAGNEPDVIFFFTDINSKPLVEQNKVISVEEIRAEYPEYAKNISQGAMDSARCVDGKEYAVPVRGFYEGLFCNKDLFEANGIELPTTWDNLIAAVKGFKEKGITPIAVSLGEVPNYWIEHFILAEAGAEGHANRNLEEVKDLWVKGLAHFKEFADMGAFPADAAVAQHAIVTESFANKQAAMFIDGNWAVNNLDVDNTVVMPIPAAPGSTKDPSAIVGGYSSGFYITRKAWEDPAKKDAAVKFVEHMTTNEIIGQYLKAAGAGAPAAEVGEVAGLSPLALNGGQMAAQAKSTNTPVNDWLQKPAWDYLFGKVPGLAAGKEDPAAVMDEVIKLENSAKQ
ncbi:MAG: ABC transporter substrate-binding protein [Cellulosilyticaceae bacterium]